MPTVLALLKLPANKAYTEKEFEEAIIDNLQQFLLEQGKRFFFCSKAKQIRTETKIFIRIFLTSVSWKNIHPFG
ncbi:PDDEXK nuclease domain-containing protein [Arachidicoccus sp.]|uniref:PDDEXK nuclease domain-containing protein n=1 Tax=Arachidicoccus sp. TaxID=1872624 RepID=UPI003D1C4285